MFALCASPCGKWLPSNFRSFRSAILCWNLSLDSSIVRRMSEHSPLPVAGVSINAFFKIDVDLPKTRLLGVVPVLSNSLKNVFPIIESSISHPTVVVGGHSTFLRSMLHRNTPIRRSAAPRLLWDPAVVLSLSTPISDHSRVATSPLKMLSLSATIFLCGPKIHPYLHKYVRKQLR